MQCRVCLPLFLVAFTLAAAPISSDIYAQSSQSSWSGQFALPGLGQGCQAITAANDQLYCAQAFQVPGFEPSALLAIWDGAEWRYEGPGTVPVTTGGVLHDIAVVGTDIYLGGSFTVTDENESEVHNLARWDGEAWHAVGEGINGEVRALASSGTGDLYVGGVFTEAGGLEANNVARWDGAAWSLLEDQGGLVDGTNGMVTALVVGNSAVYVAGSFSTAGGSNAERIARWNWTTSEWSPLGAGVTDDARGLAVSAGGDVYVAADGDLIADPNITANGIAMWDGSEWSAVGSGAPSSTDVVAAPNGEIYASGDFSADAGPNASAFAAWDGTQWHAVGGDSGYLDLPPFDIAAIGTEVYVAGNEFFMEEMRTNGVAHWDDSRWSGLGEGVGHHAPAVTSRIIEALLKHDGRLYAGGTFEFAGPDSIASLAGWDGSDWHELGAGLARTSSVPQVYGLAAYESDLCAGGWFTHAGGNPAGNVACWDGAEWSLLDGGVAAGVVHALQTHDGVLYAAGDFDEAGGGTAKSIAMWDGQGWSPLAGGLGGTAYAMISFDNDLYVGGNLFYANGAFIDPGSFEVNSLARWDGTAWHDVGMGVEGVVYAMATDGDNLFVGGLFSTAGTGIAANNIAMWNGENWTALGEGLNGSVRALFANGDGLYAGGEFSASGEIPLNNLARWTGSDWETVESGVLPAAFTQARGVYTLEGTEEGLYVGGTFGFAGNRSSLNIALWTDFDLQPVDVERPSERVQQFALHPIHPNPFSSRATIDFEIAEPVHVKITVFDILGREVAIVVDGVRSPGRHTAELEARNLPGGVYFCELEIGSIRQTRSVVLAR